MDWQTLLTHWKWLFGSLPMAFIGGLTRRKGLHPWLAFKRQWDLNKANVSLDMENQRLRRDLRSTEESRANEQRLREAATAALAAMVTTGKIVEEARKEGRIVISGISSVKRTSSHSAGPRSPHKPKPGPLDLP